MEYAAKVCKGLLQWKVLDLTEDSTKGYGYGYVFVFVGETKTTCSQRLNNSCF